MQLRRWSAVSGVLVAGLVVVVVWIAAVGIPRERDRFIAQWRSQLAAMAGDRQMAIERWVDERLRDAAVVAAYPTVAAAVVAHASDGVVTAAERAHLAEVLHVVATGLVIREIVLADRNGNVLAEEGGRVDVLPACRALMQRAMDEGAPRADFCAVRGEEPVATFVAPIGPRPGGPPVGAVVLAVDPREWLYPYLTRLPTSSSSAETLLAGEHRGEVLFLSPLRHRPDAPLSFHLPVETRRLAAVSVLSGHAAFASFRDYRDVPVFALGTRLRNAPWGLVVKVDRDEVLHGFRRWVGSVVLLLTGLVIGVAGVAYGAQRRKNARLLVEKAHADTRFALLLEEAGDAVFFVARDGTIREASARVRDMYGYDPRELRGRDIAGLCAPSERAAVAARLADASPGDAPRFEATHLRADGTPFPVEVSRRLVSPDEGDEVFLDIVRDISERRSAEELLRRQGMMLREAGELAHVGGWEFDPVTLEGSWTAETARIHDVDPDAPTDARMGMSFYVGDSRERIEAAVREAIEHGTPYDLELEMISAIGTRKWVRTICYPTVEDGRAVRIRGSIQDITEHRLAEQALRESEDRLRAFFDSALIGTLVGDVEGAVVAANDEYLRIIGYTREDLEAGRVRWDAVTPPEFAPLDVRGIEEAQRRGECVPYEKQYVRKDGSRVWVLVGFVLVGEGRRRSVAFILDISARKQAEAEARRLNEELEERVRERTAELEAANKELEAFSYSVSHDLRAPLRAVDGFSRMLVEDYGARLDEEGRRLVGVVRENTQRMGRLIDDLLAFSRAGRAELRRQRLDMKSLVDAVCRDLGVGGEAGRVELVVGALPDARGDGALLRQVWENLLSNAVKFSGRSEGPRIEVSGRADGPQVVYEVRDNGVGFDMQYASKLFGVFQRLHGVREFPGTGVGLALVQRIVARHGGRVWAHAAVGEGASFCFTLPAAPEKETR